LGGSEVLASRLAGRTGHFADVRLLASQLETLEPPGSDEALVVDIGNQVSEIVERISAWIEPSGA
jgi:gluconokinase